MIIDKYPKEWNKVVPFSNSIPHILLLRIYEQYNSEIWDAVIDMVPFHKLSYKLDVRKAEKENTFYSEILRR